MPMDTTRQKRVERKLAAILAADVVGYSRLMGANEEDTFERLKAHRRELLSPKLSLTTGASLNLPGMGR